MNKLFSFLIITLLMFMVLEIFNAEDISMKSQDLSYNFATDALASLNENEAPPTSGIDYSAFDPTVMLLLGTGLVGLAGLGIRKKK
ncbi:hypothetical protein [Desulfosarcina variabilis]|uniref:hypothetical protein n=1 Tax=Desulfosarcina variabilis TaxID=2300 RepID=UPI003AFAA883